MDDDIIVRHTFDGENYGRQTTDISHFWTSRNSRENICTKPTVYVSNDFSTHAYFSPMVDFSNCLGESDFCQQSMTKLEI